jgi:hypothetical protein
VYYRNTLTTGNAENSFFFGDPGDRFVTGDWSDAEFGALAVGTPDTPAIFRPGDATFYFRDSNSQGNATAILPFGAPSWLPVSGDTGSDSLVLQHPPRPPSPASTTSFDCTNPFLLNSVCEGNTDPADAANEGWACLFPTSTAWNCSGDIDKTDAAGETWSCTLGTSGTDWDCSGDIDKRRPGTEAWSCSIILGVGWGCSGDIDGRSAANETWTCTAVLAGIGITWSCSGDVDRSSPALENWTCEFTTEIDWTCTGSHSWNAPIVASINGFTSFGSQLSVSALNLDATKQPRLLSAILSAHGLG